MKLNPTTHQTDPRTDRQLRDELGLGALRERAEPDLALGRHRAHERLERDGRALAPPLCRLSKVRFSIVSLFSIALKFPLR